MGLKFLYEIQASELTKDFDPHTLNSMEVSDVVDQVEI